MLTHLPRLLVSAPRSGSGKTTLACALMGALRERGMEVLACKCGPDYVDPTLHERLGVRARVNLDPFFQPEGLLRDLLAHAGAGCDIACIEGAMGFYDGVGTTVEASAWDVARITSTPAVLVLDARGAAASLAAQVLGFVRMREPSQLAGVVLGHASGALADRLAPLVERECGLPVLGHLPHDEALTLPSRHLGLVCAQDIADVDERLARLAAAARDCLDLDALLSLAQTAPDITHDGAWPPAGCLDAGQGAPLIAVARDEAFCFYYAEELEMLQALGARLAFFSPLHDNRLPDGAAGLFLGGGYPELHARELARNASMLASVRQAIAQGMPTLAECGGFLYLHEALADEDGLAWPCVGAFPGTAARKAHGRFGYVELTTQAPSLLGPAGTTLRGHEFHRWDSPDPGQGLLACKPASTRSWRAGHCTESLYAGFPHLYLPRDAGVAARFVRACARWGRVPEEVGDPCAGTC